MATSWMNLIKRVMKPIRQVQSVPSDSEASESVHLADDPDRGIQWLDSVEEAMACARFDGKPVFVASSSRKEGQCGSPHY